MQDNQGESQHLEEPQDQLPLFEGEQQINAMKPEGEEVAQKPHANEILQGVSPISLLALPSPPNVLREGGVIMPRFDTLEAVLFALSNAQRSGGWQEVGQVPTYVHHRERSTTEVRLRPAADAVVTDADLSSQLWQRVRGLNDLTGDILLAVIAQMVGAEGDPRQGTWITSTLILEYRGIQPKASHKREKPKVGMSPARVSGHRLEDLQLIAEHFNQARDLHVTVRTWKESHKKVTPRKRVYTQESYLLLVSDYIEQTTLLSDQKSTSLQVAWHVFPGACLEALLSEPNNYQATWLLQCVLKYDPYHEMWEKRLGRYCCFQLRLNRDFGGVTITRRIGTLLDELGLEVNVGDPVKSRKRFERAMDRLQDDGIISEWGPAPQYQHQIGQLPRYNWLPNWFNIEIAIFAAPLSHTEKDLLQEHLQRQRTRKKKPNPGEPP